MHKTTIQKPRPTLHTNYAPYTLLDFHKIERQAKKLADLIDAKLEKLTDVLLKYESYEVVQDEIARTIGLLKNIRENIKYFHTRVGAVTSFLPRNQPLYALACFVIVPSLMASEVHFRIPKSMHGFFQEMLDVLGILHLFPNIFISSKQRLEFLKERSALYLNPKNKETKPVTEVVIFTGTSIHADQLRSVFSKHTLFIANGAGHNPVVISQNADISLAVKAVLTLQFYNQGQDCAAPNSILVHKNIMPEFMEAIRVGIQNIKVGEYSDKSCRVGPISDPKDLVRIQDFIVENREWLDPSTPGIIHSREAIVEPTIICKPLIKGGNFNEIFAPIIFVQEYEKDVDLKHYFEEDHYAPNAMHISLYGKSKYIENLVGRSTEGRIFHDKKSILHNTNPHVPGFERGTQPYGGYGYGASSVAINGKILPMPTLPQRDIYEWIVKPMIDQKSIKIHRKEFQRFTTIQQQNVEKILKIKALRPINKNEIYSPSEILYLDSNSLKNKKTRYQKIKSNDLYRLLKKRNTEYIETLETKDLKLIQDMKNLIDRKSSLSFDEFCATIYNIPKKTKATKTENKVQQFRFFRNMYQLLFNKNSGPQLGPFLWDIKKESIDKLLYV